MPPAGIPATVEEALVEAGVLGILDTALGEINNSKTKWSASGIPLEAFLLLHSYWAKGVPLEQSIEALIKDGIFDQDEWQLAEELVAIPQAFQTFRQALSARDPENAPYTPGAQVSGQFLPKFGALGGLEGAYTAYLAKQEMHDLGRVRRGNDRAHVREEWPQRTPERTPERTGRNLVAKWNAEGRSLPFAFTPNIDEDAEPDDLEGTMSRLDIQESPIVARLKRQAEASSAAPVDAPTVLPPPSSTPATLASPTDPDAPPLELPRSSYEANNRAFHDTLVRSLLSTILDLSVIGLINVVAEERTYSFGVRHGSAKPVFNARADGQWIINRADTRTSFMSYEIKKDRRVGAAGDKVCRQETAQIAAMIWQYYDLGNTALTADDIQKTVGSERWLMGSFCKDVFVLIAVEFDWEWVEYLRHNNSTMRQPKGWAKFTRYGEFRVSLPDHLLAIARIMISLALHELRKDKNGKGMDLYLDAKRWAAEWNETEKTDREAVAKLSSEASLEPLCTRSGSERLFRWIVEIRAARDAESSTPGAPPRKSRTASS
ncbi:hypothetical protein K491DRAFT_718860 [Lophiostoma macrostomum CBS 122681]|uniref:Uncharacterized protein n=1 Tax=Lophiostoma macrostomum CBS 122681 TaxID=1314788 RepID=A0A6A6SXP7_9PLEO|nr:hypothetical protein K491DRAFT_718860 [Lophiostoma macrostomum CBS 122681]